jgi:CRISPR-associated protein (TIGR03984 family)
MTEKVINSKKHQDIHPECNSLNLESIADDLRAWLQEQANKYKLQFLIAHADDGIIWGRFDRGYTLTTSDQVFPEKNLASLRISTLKQCRVFSNNAEVMLWRIDDAWQSRVVNDKNCTEDDYISESQMLWGTKAEDEADGFTYVADGSEGLKHAVPLQGIPFTSDRSKLIRPIRLIVRHYIDYNKDGVARIYLSRLVDLDTVVQ